MMLKTECSVEKLVLPTYPEPAAEELPMFAENRVHQRTSGRPYPNKVVMRVQRETRVDREYTAVRLENEYLRIIILPEIGGRIYSALDKTTGYDFFYKQHVIKPALIGVLGSWVSGGVEFNWPFHHRASGFMPCDFKTETLPDGTAICWLSEHDPIDRMRGTIGIVLRPGENRFETRMQLYNRTPQKRSFLWWENAAVPVNKDYQIFFPQDVSYVNFHYLKSRISYPVAGNGVFNGIPMKEPRDISQHRNTEAATSYFSSASRYDFFGGYDHGRECGVVHIGDHHLSPGKKMFTWGYGPLSKIWENALTDTDGAYAELMAGSYSDNQPDFAWLEPYETKQFSQYWYPISKIGAPTFANLNGAFRLEREEGKGTLKLQSTQLAEQALVRVTDGDTVCFETTCTLTPGEAKTLEIGEIPPFVTVSVSCKGEELATYTEQVFDTHHTPEPIQNTPSSANIDSVEELYLAGLHVQQYRDPAVMPDAYWKEALSRDPHHTPSLIAMAGYELERGELLSARKYIEHAIKRLTRFNTRLESGEAYYIYARILEQLGEYDEAYSQYYKASWAADCVGKAMTRIAMLDLKNDEPQKAAEHADTALSYGGKNSLAVAVRLLAANRLGGTAENVVAPMLKREPLDHMLRFLTGDKAVYADMLSNPAQTCLDLTFDLTAMGAYDLATELLTGLVDARPEYGMKMVLYTLGWLCEQQGENGDQWYEKAKLADLGPAYPSRPEEVTVLKSALKAEPGNTDAALLLGCLYYSRRQYEEAVALWRGCTDSYIGKRNLAVAYFSHFDREEEALSLMLEALKQNPDDQLLYETVNLMNKMAVPAEQKIALLQDYEGGRDDILVELAKAYNGARRPDDALNILENHQFIPCEGGEHAVSDQYMFAYLLKGRIAYKEGDIKTALSYFRRGQQLPVELGFGIWNHCKLVPLKYHEALCLERLGETEKAEEIYRYITGIEREYFSDMYLKELPYFQAKAHLRLNETLEARKLVTTYRREWEGIADQRNDGFFNTTPFFISFVDQPARLRRDQYLWLTALMEDCMGRSGEAEKKLSDLLSGCTENLTAMTFLLDRFPD